MLAWMLSLLITAAPQSEGLAAIERKIAKEPKYSASEQLYALLVLGPKMDKRVWFVLDGEDLYVDANGNGDLTEPGERFAATSTKGPESLTLRSREWRIAKLAGSERYGDIRVHYSAIDPKWRPEKSASNCSEMERFMRFVGKTPNANMSNIHVTIEGGRRQFCSAMFTTSAATAPIFHMDGPLSVGVLETIAPHELGRTKDLEQIQVAVGTPGFGGDQPGCFSYVMYDEFKDAGKPVLDIEFPSADGKPTTTRHYELDGKC